MKAVVTVEIVVTVVKAKDVVTGQSSAVNNF
jgi:hypothetical protein